MRKYSFQDIETLIEIANQLEEGIWTSEIRKELKRKEQPLQKDVECNSILSGEG